MKKFLKVLGIIVWAIVLIIILAFVFTSGIAKTANTMFHDLKMWNIEQVYQSTAGQFQAATTLDQFKSFVNDARLNTNESVFRSSREVVNNRGFLNGTLKLVDGSKLPIEVDLIKEDGKWKVLSIYMPQWWLIDKEQTSYENQWLVLQQEPVIAEIPSDREIMMLVQTSIMLFAEGIKREDLTIFYNNISQFRQEQTSPGELTQVFYPFIENKIDFSSLFWVEPQYSALPEIDNNGILFIKWWMPFEETAVIFEQKYYNENGEWKLFWFALQVA